MHISILFKKNFFSIADIQCHISFRCRTVIHHLWAHHECSHHLSPYNTTVTHWLHSLHCAFIPMTYSFRNRKPAPPTPLHWFYPTLYSPTLLATITSFSVFINVIFFFVYSFVLFFQILCMTETIRYLSFLHLSICLFLSKTIL